MGKPVTITTTLDADMNNWLKEEAKRQKTTKRVIIERAVEYYLTDQTRKLYAEGFKKMNDDPEVLEMAEWGMGDYYDNLKPYL